MTAQQRADALSPDEDTRKAAFRAIAGDLRLRLGYKFPGPGGVVHQLVVLTLTVDELLERVATVDRMLAETNLAETITNHATILNRFVITDTAIGLGDDRLWADTARIVAALPDPKAAPPVAEAPDGAPSMFLDSISDGAKSKPPA